MFAISKWRGALTAAVAAVLTTAQPVEAQLVDNPQNLLKSWSDAYASRKGEPMARVYSHDAQLWTSQTPEPVVGIAGIKAHYDRTGENVAERSATVTRVQVNRRKRLTMVTGTMVLRSKTKDGAARSRQARFSMSIIRESRRQWAILSHHVSLLPTAAQPSGGAAASGSGK